MNTIYKPRQLHEDLNYVVNSLHVIVLIEAAKDKGHTKLVHSTHSH